jgi:predicted nucleotidyltransferase
MEHGLTERHLAEIKAILLPFVEGIKRVSLYGSRAKGTYKSYSDIDLVIEGSLSGSDIKQLKGEFDESNLPYMVDVCALDHIAYPPLKANILNEQVPLFDKEALAALKNQSA